MGTRTRSPGRSRRHPLLRLALFVPLSALFLAWPATSGRLSAGQWLAGVIGGLALWTLIEYLLHRFAFHWVPRSPRLRELQLHLEHHAHPTDPHTNVTPLSFSVPVTLLLWGAFMLALGSVELGTVVAGGAVLGYAAYELIHFATHMSSYDRGLMRFWRSHHFEHHAHPRTCYGFTTPLWDIVFRTTRRGGAHRGSTDATSGAAGDR